MMQMETSYQLLNLKDWRVCGQSKTKRQRRIQNAQKRKKNEINTIHMSALNIFIYLFRLLLFVFNVPQTLYWMRFPKSQQLTSNLLLHLEVPIGTNLLLDSYYLIIIEKNASLFWSTWSISLNSYNTNIFKGMRHLVSCK